MQEQIERRDNMKIAVDGPSGAGKSSLAKEIAKRLSFIYIDTGAMYRTVGLYCLENGIDVKDEKTVVDALNKITIGIELTEDVQKMFLNGNDVTDKKRTPEISAAASAVAVIGKVREFLVDKQRKLASENDVIMDGRDIATCVLPDAEVKIFLTASPEARAERRYKELVEKGLDVNLNQILEDMIKRDKNDSERACSPLSVHKDAIVLDTSNLNIEQSLDAMLKIIENAGE